VRPETIQAAAAEVGLATSGIPEEQWPLLLQQMTRQSCAFYASQILQGPPEPPYNGRFLVGEHHEEWSDLVSNHERICVLASRDHGKSYFFNLAYPLWMAEKHPGREGFIFSRSQPQAEEILQKIADEVDSNDNLLHLRPDSKARHWSSKKIRLANGHTIYARGYGTKVRGAHPVWIVVDDGLNDEDAYSEIVRNKNIEYFYSAISNMIVPGGQIIVVGCVTLDTWVPTGSGLRRIGDLCPGEFTPQTVLDLDLPVFGRDGLRNATKFWVNGECPTKRVTLECGLRIEGSHRHPLLVMGEDGRPFYKRCDEIEKGDYVAVHVGAECWGPPADLRPFKARARTHTWIRNEGAFPDELSPDLAYLIGLWTAEGSYESTGRVSISNTEEEIRAWLMTHPFDLRFKPCTTLGSEQTLRCSSKDFLDLIEWLGGRLATASGKTVPRAIMEGSRDCAVAFLQGFFDGDGGAYATTEGLTVSAASVSEALARDVQQLLLNVGVLATCSRRPMQASERAPNPNYDVWIVRATGVDADVYMRSVGFRLSRKQAAAADARAVRRSRPIPYQGALIAQMRREKPDRRAGRTLGKIAVHPPTFSISQVAKHRLSGADVLDKVYAWFAEAGARGPATEQLRHNIDEARRGRAWLRVAAVEDSNAFTVDFVIPDGHSFVSNGIVSHNTPFSARDLYGDLAHNPKYTFRRYPAWNAETKRALWPERYDAARLESKRQEIGNIRFQREFLCQPVGDSSSLFPLEFFQGSPVEVFAAKLGLPWQWWENIGVTQRFMGVDFAMSTNIGADYSVIWVMGMDKAGNRWVIDILRERGLGFQAQLSKINAAARRYNPQLIFVESNQMQRIFGDELIRTTDLPVRQCHTGDNKNSLEKGIPSLRVLLETRKLRIPRGDQYSIEMTDIWINEMRNHTFVNGKVQTVGEHDDCVAPGAMVTTRARGLVPIERVCVGEEVLTHKGRWRRVTGVMNRPYAGPIVHLKASGLLPLRVTPRHPVWRTQPLLRETRLAVDETSWAFAPAGSLETGVGRDGHLVYAPCPADGATSTPRFDLADFIVRHELPNGGPRWKVSDDEVWWRDDRRLPRALHVTPDFAFVIGLYLAEGSTGGCTGRRHVVSFGLHERETYIAAAIGAWSEQAFAAPVKTHANGARGRSIQAVFHSVPGAAFFRQLGHGVEKCLPHAWMEWPLALRLRIVRGWLVGDGNIYKGSARGVSCSRQLIEQMRQTLVAADYAPNVGLFDWNRARGGAPAWRLHLSVADTYRLLAEPNEVERQRWGDKVHAPGKAHANVRALVAGGGGRAHKLEFCRTEPYDGRVYNLEVEEDNSYVVEGVAVHNCAMAFYLCEQAIRSGTFGFSFSEEEGDNEAYKEVMSGLPMPGIDDFVEDDEFYEEAMLDPNFVLGEEYRRRLKGANLVGSDGTEDEDRPMRAHALQDARWRGRKERRAPQIITPGQPPPGEDYASVRPSLGAPPASALFWKGGGFGR
jgi:hypothetical protein